MNEFKGTPGNWSIDQTGDIVSGPYNVCIPYATKAEDKMLMAASKDLFEALRGIMNHHASNVLFHNKPMAEKAWAALAKALGQ